MTAKLPTEAELDVLDRVTSAGNSTPPSRTRRLIAIGREYYALRRKLRELVERVRFGRGLATVLCSEIEALLGEDM